MKIFISSLIAGFEPFRSAARSAVTTLRHEPVMAEDFGALSASPQVACLQGLRSADLVILILGNRYGTVQGTSGISPTHEEYSEARGRKPILLFVQESVDREPLQAKFIAEVQGWQEGHFRAGFATAEELKVKVIQAIHDYQLATAGQPLDVAALIASAAALLPASQRNGYSSGSARLNIAVVGGPSQSVLRPAELEAAALADDFERQAMFGPQRLFDKAKGMESGMERSLMFLQQEGGARIQLDEHGSLLLQLPLERSTERDLQRHGGMFAILEEDVVRELASAIAYADWALERIDPTRRITHVALAVSIEASEHMGWRTKTEQEASPNSISMRMGRQQTNSPIHVDRPRASLRLQAQHVAEDLMVPLRRQWKNGR